MNETFDVQVADTYDWPNIHNLAPKVSSRKVYTYEMLEHPMPFQENMYEPTWLITKVDIIVERDSSGEVFIDTDAWGYLATKDGQRDKRAKLTRVWADRATYAPFIYDVGLYEEPS